MKKISVAGLVLVLLMSSLLSGCILVPVDDGYRSRDSGGSHERDRGGHRGEGHERH